MYHILICDDEKDIVSALQIYLNAEGYQTFPAYTGKEALDILEKEEIHLVLMDIMMPEMDGISALVKLREQYNLPVILLTAKSEDSDKVLGLNVGADDYVTKPFNPVEVIARVKSQLRRYMQLGSGIVQEKTTLKVGNIEMDDSAKIVTRDGEVVNLTPTEYDILRMFLKNPGHVLSPKEIYKEVWKDEPYGAESTVAVHIRHLREKIEPDPGHPQWLHTVRGIGYRLTGEV